MLAGLDLFVANRGATNFLYKQDAASSGSCSAAFTRQSSSIVESGVSESYDADWADIDGDGDVRALRLPAPDPREASLSFRAHAPETHATIRVPCAD